MITTPATDLNEQRLSAFLAIKAIEHDIDTGMSHWYEEYKAMSLSALREEARIQGIAPTMRKAELVDALLGRRVASRQQEIATLRATVASLNERIG